jgi:hypothetical protein
MRLFGLNGLWKSVTFLKLSCVTFTNGAASTWPGPRAGTSMSGCGTFAGRNWLVSSPSGLLRSSVSVGKVSGLFFAKWV